MYSRSMAMDSKTILNAMEIKTVVNNFVHLLVDGYADVFQLVKYCFAVNWLPLFQYGTTVSKALAAFMKRKHSITIFVVNVV